MLNPLTVKKGDHVFKVEWVDLTDRDTFAQVREYVIHAWGSKFGETQFTSPRSLDLSRPKRTLAREIAREFSATRDLAVMEAMAQATRKIKDSQSAIKRANWELEKLAALKERLENK